MGVGGFLGGVIFGALLFGGGGRPTVGERSRITGPSAPLRDRSKSTGLMAMVVGAQTLWEDASGKWATVEDYSVKGICADAGIMFSKSYFQASFGISTIAFKKPALELGLGIRF